MKTFQIIEVKEVEHANGNFWSATVVNNFASGQLSAKGNASLRKLKWSVTLPDVSSEAEAKMWIGEKVEGYIESVPCKPYPSKSKKNADGTPVMYTKTRKVFFGAEPVQQTVTADVAALEKAL